MYKTKLQEVCQKRMWPLPLYTSSREGPDHDPRFAATVVVNGLSFYSAETARSSKEAHNLAAQSALVHIVDPPAPFSPSPPPSLSGQLSPPPSPIPQPSPAADSQVAFKSQLQTLVQRRFNCLPVYGFTRVGPPHALRFMATVTVDGQTYESPQFCNTLREAEHAAAKVALMALPSDEIQQEEPGFYKNLLQELAQKESFSLPVYKTVRNGGSHMPIFSSTVEIGGKTFEGDIGRTRKQAEMNAAKVAWTQLKEQKERTVPSSLSGRFQVQKDIAPVSTRSQEAVIMNLRQPIEYSVQRPQVNFNEEDRDTTGEDGKDLHSPKPAKNDLKIVDSSLLDNQQTDSSSNVVGTGLRKKWMVSSSLPGRFQVQKDIEPASTRSQEAVVMNLQQPLEYSVQMPQVKIIKEDKDTTGKDDKDSHAKRPIKNESNIIDSSLWENQQTDLSSDAVGTGLSFPDNPQTDSCSDVVRIDEGRTEHSAISTLELAPGPKAKKEETMECVPSEDVSSSLSMTSKSDVSSSDCKVTEANSKLSDGAACSLLGNRVQVYPRKPDIVLPEGAELLPFSDDKWVAVCLDFKP